MKLHSVPSKVLSLAITVVAVAATSLTLAPSGAGGATPRRFFVPPVRPLRLPPAGTARLRPQSNATSPTPCTVQYSTNGNYSFVGFTGGGDVAGGDDSAVLGGNSNGACDSGDGVGAGLFNTVGNGGSAYYSFIGAGQYNGISGEHSFIGGGSYGEVGGNDSFIGAGGYAYAVGGGTASGNQVAGSDSFLGAGDTNMVNANAAFLGSGQSNVITSAASYSFLSGGVKNVVSGMYSAVMAGYNNTASGEYATVLGGNTTTAAGELSLAAGYHADATHTGSFVWSDFSSGSALVKDTAPNQFVVRSSGGTTFYSNEGLTSGVHLAAGSGTWASLSDRNAKTAIVPLDDASMLAKVVSLPLSSWSYTSERGVRHVGPMAQDFYAAFGVGEDDRHVTSIDEDGVALAAIKALHGENAKLRGEIARLRSRFAARDAALERRLDLIEARTGNERPAALRR